MSALVVNFIGGPGIGKSLWAHRTVAELKLRGHRAMLVPDYASLRVYGGSEHALQDYLACTAEINTALTLAARGGNKFIVMENPLMMSSLYAEGFACHRELEALVVALDRTHPSLNLLLSRQPELAYPAEGRHLDEHGALSIDAAARAYLDRHTLPYTVLPVTTGAADFAAQIPLLCDRIVAAGRAPSPIRRRAPAP